VRPGKAGGARRDASTAATILALAGRVQEERPSAVAVGTFDGVHLGHRRLMEEVIAEARRLEGPGRSGAGTAVAITFRRPPRAVIEPGASAPHLCSLEERLTLLEGLGLDVVIPMDFDDEIRLMTALDFTLLLKRHLNLAALVIGPGTAIGHDMVGDRAGLEAVGRDAGFRVRIVEPVLYRSSPVRSSAVRTALGEGRVRDAAAMLGRPFAVSGPVAAGDRRGRDLGFPTANLALSPDAALPSDGVYAAWAIVAGARHAAAVSVGVRPTFGGGANDARTVETFLLGFQGDLYGEKMRVEFVERLRAEKRFPDAEALVRQMSRDIEAARQALEGPSLPRAERAKP